MNVPRCDLGGDIGIDPEILRLVPFGRRRAVCAAFGPPGDEIVVIAVEERATANLGGDVRIDREILRLVPVLRDAVRRLAALGPPGELVVLAARLEILASNRRRHVGMDRQ